MSFTNVMTLFRTGHVMSLALNTFIEMSTFQIFLVAMLRNKNVKSLVGYINHYLLMNCE